MNETLGLAKRVCEITDAILTAERLLDIRYKLLDWFGCAVGVVGTELTRRLSVAFDSEAGCGNSTVFCCEKNYPLLTAAFLNGAQSHILECDDVHKSAITHPGIVAVTAALMASEHTGASFRDFALGSVAGYEVMIRLGNALNPSHYDHWHTAGTCGTFAATAAAAKVFDLDAKTLERAFGIAATMASGLTCVFGTDAKLVTIGNAIRNGIQAALMAQAGVTSVENVIGRTGGYACAVSRLDNYAALAEETDVPMIDTACYKMYASCGHTHSALDALFSLLKERSFRAEEVEHIEVRVYTKAGELIGEFKNESPSRAKFSLPYCVSAAMIDGAVSVRQFLPERIGADDLRKFARKVFVTTEPEYDKFYPQKRIETVAVTLKSGETLSKTVELPLGRPPYSFVEDKFATLAGMTMRPETVQSMKDLILEFDFTGSVRILTQKLKGMIDNGKLHD